MKARAYVLAVAVLLAHPWALAGLGSGSRGTAADARAQSRPPVPPPAATISDSTPSLEGILERYVEAVGGREAFERLETRVVTGRMVTDLPTWEPPRHEVDSLAVYSKVPGMHMTVREAPDGTVVEGSDGERSWKRDIDGSLSGPRTVDTRHDWLVDPQHAIRLREHFPDMRLLGEAVLDGRRVYAIDIDEKHLHRFYFDAESHLLLRIGYNRKLLDYTEVDGVMIPFRIEYSRKGGSSTLMVDSVSHNEPLEDEFFARPE